MKPTNQTNEKARIRPCSHKELAVMYQMDKRTISRWLKPHQDIIGNRIGRYYTVRQVALIFEILGYPNCMDNT